MVQMASPPRHLLASCFNSPVELDDYTYRTDRSLSISVHDGILDISLVPSEVPVVTGFMYKYTFPGSGIRVKAKIDARTDAPNLNALYSLIIAGATGYDPSFPLLSDRVLVFGYSPPYLYFAQLQEYDNIVVLYSEGSWDGSETGYHTFEVALYLDMIELYIDGRLVYTYYGNPFANDNVYAGFMFHPIGGVRTFPSVAFLHADWLFVDPIDSPPGDPPDLLEVCGGSSACDIGSTASSVMDSLANTLGNITSFISENVNTIAGVVFATGFTSMLYKHSRRITSAVTRLLRL